MINSDKSKYTLAYKIGNLVGIIFGLCVASVVVASTIKFIMWLF